LSVKQWGDLSTVRDRVQRGSARGDRSVRMRDNGTGNNPKILSTGKQVGTEGDLTIPAKAAYARNPKPSPWYRF